MLFYSISVFSRHCAVLVRRTDKHKKRNNKTNATRQTHQIPKKKPQTTDSLLLYFPRTPTTLHTDTKTDNTTERHSSLQQYTKTNNTTERHSSLQQYTKTDNTTERHFSLQQWLQQDDMVATLEDEGGKKPVEREKDTHHVGVRSIFLCSDVCTCCTSSFDTKTTTIESESVCPALKDDQTLKTSK
jgi:hypothetical protein